MVRKEIGKRIKSLREASGLTREELAEKAEISSKFLYEVEKGIKGLSADTLLKISKTLSCSCDYIMTGELFEREQIDQGVRILNSFEEREKQYVVRLLSVMKEMCDTK